MKKIVILFVCLLIAWLCFHFGRKSAEPEVVKIVQTDTVTNLQIKTVKYDEPKLISTKFDDIHLVPIPQLPDFAPKKFDTDFDLSRFALMREVKIYQDSTYMAQVSGIDVQLDYIETYNKTIIREITRVEQIKTKPKRWGLGVHAGYSFIAGQFRPYVGVGLSYNFVVF